MLKKVGKFISRYKFIILGLLIASFGVLGYLNTKTTFSEKTYTTVWDGTIADSFSGGTGISTDPYIISDGSELAYFFQLINGPTSTEYSNKFYNIDNNINLNGFDFSQIDSHKIFSGVINGNGYTISNFTMNNCDYNEQNNTSRCSLFNELSGATIKNINFTDASITITSDEYDTEVSFLANKANNSRIYNLTFTNIELEENLNNNLEEESTIPEQMPEENPSEETEPQVEAEQQEPPVENEIEEQPAKEEKEEQSIAPELIPEEEKEEIKEESIVEETANLASKKTVASQMLNVVDNKQVINMLENEVDIVEHSIISSGILIDDNGGNEISNINISIESNITEKALLVYNYNDSIVANIITNIKDVPLSKNGEIETNLYQYTIENDNVVFESGETLDVIINMMSNEDGLSWDYSNGIIRILNNGFDPEINDSPTISEGTITNPHTSGVAGDTVYVNDLEADRNYYMGLNYTNNAPSISKGNYYGNNNLVRVEARYHAYECTNANSSGTCTATGTSGAVSNATGENGLSNYVYYKVYPTSTCSTGTGTCVLVELPDNPWAKRPNGKMFNGWYTIVSGVKINLDGRYYKRTAEIPVTVSSGTPQDVQIDFYTSWTEGKLARTSQGWSAAINSLDAYGWVQASEETHSGFGIQSGGDYIDLSDLYTRITVQYGQNFQNGDYIQSGYNWVQQTSSNKCNSGRGCTTYRKVGTGSYSATTEYYNFANNTFTRVYPAAYNVSVGSIGNGDLLVGYYKEVKLSRGVSQVGYYGTSTYVRGTGNITQYLLNELTGTCQQATCTVYEYQNYFKNGTINKFVTGDTAKYYYYVTRDTNIIVLNSNAKPWAQGDTKQNKPFTLTAYESSTVDNYRNYYFDPTGTNNAAASVHAYNDLAIEYVRINGRVATSDQFTFGGNGSFFAYTRNVKLGRNIASTNNNRTFASFSSNSQANTSAQNAPARFRVIIESGTFNLIESLTEQNGYFEEAEAVYGNDLDRVKNDNTKLDVNVIAGTVWSGTVNGTRGKDGIIVTVKSGWFGSSKTSTTTGLYVGGTINGTINVSLTMIIEGGETYNVTGGPRTGATYKDDNMIHIYMKGGVAQNVFGGAGITETYGNRIVQVTGGTVKYSVFGASNGKTSTNNDGKLTGKTFVYIGGNAVIGDQTIVNNNTPDNINTTESGSVFGSGNGNSSTAADSAIGDSLGTNIVIADEALIRRNVYVGGNYGAMGSKATSAVQGNILIIGGTINGSVFGGGNNRGIGNNQLYPNTTNITMTGGTVVGSIYGGSNSSGAVNASTKLDIQGGTIGNVYGGGLGQSTSVRDNVEITIGTDSAGPTITTNVYGGSERGTVNTQTNKSTTIKINNGTINGSVFGGGNQNGIGTSTSASSVNLTVYGGTIIGNVYGGSNQSGTVYGPTNVTISGGTVGNVFGGGKGSQTFVKEDVTVIIGTSTTNNTLTLNANGGTIPNTAGWTIESGASTATKKLANGATYGTLPIPTRPGYTFDGWFTARNGGTQVTNTTTMGAANTTIYAHWTSSSSTTYTLTLNANGGRIASGTQSVTPTTITYNGHNWVTVTLDIDSEGNITAGGAGKNGGSYYNPHSCSSKVNFSGNETVKVCWGSNASVSDANIASACSTSCPTSGCPTNVDCITGIQLNYTASSLTYSEITTMQLGYNSYYGTLPTPTRSGYRFVGWFTSPTGGTQVTNTTTMGAANTTIYAHWTSSSSTTYTSPLFQSDKDSQTSIKRNVAVRAGASSTDPLINGNVYGGSELGTVNATDTNAAYDSGKKVTVVVNNGRIVGSVFGGAQGSNIATPYVIGNITTIINDGNIGNVYGGFDESGSPKGTDDSSCVVNLNGGTIGNAYGGGNKTSVTTTNITLNGATVTGNIFGGSNQTGTVTNSYLFIRSGSTNNAFGGNNEGGTNSNPVVNVTGGTIKNSLYGSGNKVGSSNTTVTIATTDGNVSIGENSSDEYAGAFGGANQANVTTTNITVSTPTSGRTIKIKNMFGGSNQTGNIDTTNITINGGTVLNSAFGGNNQGGTVTTPNIIINGGNVGNAYGGNNLGGVSNNTDLKIYGGTIGNAFGGGNQISVTNARLSLYGGTITGNAYGGSNSSGTVTNSTVITPNTNNNLRVNSIYGGNNQGGQTTNPQVTITSGTISNVYGGGNNAQSTKTSVIINGGSVGNVYGGGNNAAVINDSIVVIKSGTIDTIYTGGNNGAVNGDTSLYIQGGTVNAKAFGGGNNGVVEGDSTVLMRAGNVRGNIYGGGNGSTATVKGNNTISISGTAIIGYAGCLAPSEGSVFGGGNAAATGTIESEESIATVNIAGGTIYGNIYGGAYGFSDAGNNLTSKIYGYTDVNIGAGVTTNEDVIKDDIIIIGTIFGGGEKANNESDNYNFNAISVTKGITIDIDGTGYDVLDTFGSIFGSGNASSSAGDSVININNYGTRDLPHSNISIQRTNQLTIDNSHIILSGTTDSTNDYSDVPFTLSRIDELHLKDNSTLYLYNGSNLLKKFSSETANGGIAKVDIIHNSDGTITVDKNVDNRVYMYPGKVLNIATTQNVSQNGYGKVSGMTYFGMFKADGSGYAKTGIYQATTEYPTNGGDVLFESSTYVLGEHMLDHDIEVNGFYSNYYESEVEGEEPKFDLKYIVPTPENASYYMWQIGEGVLEVEIELTASKYATLGTKEIVFNQDEDLARPNTSFIIDGFDYTELESGCELVDKNSIQRLAPTQEQANKKMGLRIESSNQGWLTNGQTDFLSNSVNPITGTTTYVGSNTSDAPTLLMYLYHSKNIDEDGEFGTVKVSIQSITQIDDLTKSSKRLLLSIHITRAIYETADYEAAITPGRKYELFTNTATNITSKSTLSTYYSLFDMSKKDEHGIEIYDGNIYDGKDYRHVLTTNYSIPAGTKITMIDLSNTENPEYFYHVITAQEETQAAQEILAQGDYRYDLSVYERMGAYGSTIHYDDEKQYYNTSMKMTDEEFIFIIDFEDANINNNVINKRIYMELISDNPSIPDVSLLSVQSDTQVFSLYPNQDAEITVGGSILDDKTTIYTGDTFKTEVNIDINQQNLGEARQVYDTKSFESKLGVKISLLKVIQEETATTPAELELVSGTSLIGLTYTINDMVYSPNIDGTARIKVADRVDKTKLRINVNTGSSSVETGKYILRIESYASSDGIYYGLTPSASCDIPITIINEIYGLKVEFKRDVNGTPTDTPDEMVISSSNGQTQDKKNNVNLYITYNSGLSNPIVKLKMYRRDYTQMNETIYNEVELCSFLDRERNNYCNNSEGIEHTIIQNPQPTQYITLYPFDYSKVENIPEGSQDHLTTGTYKLEFILYEVVGTTQIKVGTVEKYIIIR